MRSAVSPAGPSETDRGWPGGRLLALGNACPFNLQGYRTSQTDPYWGEAMAIVEAGTEGCVTLQADSAVGSAVAAVQVHKE